MCIEAVCYLFHKRYTKNHLKRCQMLYIGTLVPILRSIIIASKRTENSFRCKCVHSKSTRLVFRRPPPHEWPTDQIIFTLIVPIFGFGALFALTTVAHLMRFKGRSDGHGQMATRLMVDGRWRCSTDTQIFAATSIHSSGAFISAQHTCSYRIDG